MIRRAAPSLPGGDFIDLARSGRRPSAFTIRDRGLRFRRRAGKLAVPRLCNRDRGSGPGKAGLLQQGKVAVMPIDEKTRTALEAAAFRRLVEHLRSRTDVQNIDLMNFAGFCRNCLSNWVKEAADQNGVPMTKDESREAIYGMPFEEWKAKYQNEASKAQFAAFTKSSQKH
jgi:uncharacterized protein